MDGFRLCINIEVNYFNLQSSICKTACFNIDNFSEILS